MNILKVLGGIGLVVLGGAVLMFGRKKNDEESQNTSAEDNQDKSIDDIIAEKYERFSETDENPYNVKGCVVPKELTQRNTNNRGEDYQTPTWVKKGKICADASANLGRAFFDFVSMGYDYYGQYMNCTETGEYYHDNIYNGGYQRYDNYSYSGGHRVINYGHNQIIF